MSDDARDMAQKVWGGKPDDGRQIARKAQGGRVVVFCPACRCGHAFVIEQSRPGGPQWTWNGSIDKPTFSPSMLVHGESDLGKFVCHSFVRDGQIQFLSDCTHKLAGQTVPLEPF